MRWVPVVALCLVAAVACERGRPPAASSSGPRLVALSPSATEVVAALGATDQLVGVDRYSTYPPEVQALPKVGDFLSPNLEQIIALRPSLVIVDDVHGRAAGALRDAGVETIECAMHGLPDVKAALRRIGAKIGKPSVAAQRVAAIDAALDAAAARRAGPRPRVLAIIDRTPGEVAGLVAAGPGSWIDELLAVVGGENVLAASGIRYPKLSREEVLRARPDVILDLSYAARDDVTAWRELDVPAIRTGRVVALDQPFLVAPSPRVEAALDALAKALAKR